MREGRKEGERGEREGGRVGGKTEGRREGKRERGERAVCILFKPQGNWRGVVSCDSCGPPARGKGARGCMAAAGRSAAPAHAQHSPPRPEGLCVHVCVRTCECAYAHAYVCVCACVCVCGNCNEPGFKKLKEFREFGYPSDIHLLHFHQLCSTVCVTGIHFMHSYSPLQE